MTAAVIAASILLALWPPAAWVALAVRYPQRFPLPARIAARLEKTPWPELSISGWLTVPFRLRRAGGEHTARAVAERTLVFDELRGQYRHAETGPMTLPQRYLDYAGKAAESWRVTP